LAGIGLGQSPRGLGSYKAFKIRPFDTLGSEMKYMGMTVASYEPVFLGGGGLKIQLQEIFNLMFFSGFEPTYCPLILNQKRSLIWLLIGRGIQF
jgi:hypothetical protein